MTYACSDVHGRYDKYLEMIDKIGLGKDDTLYVLGDVIDRGEHGIKILSDIMGRENVKFIMGNHEQLMFSALPAFVENPEKADVSVLNDEQKTDLTLWLLNRGIPTLEELQSSSAQEVRSIYDFLKNAPYYKEISAGGTDYILCHAVIENFEEDKPLSEYNPDDFLHGRPDDTEIDLKDKILVCGHTPVQYLNGSDRMSARGNLLDIDCGLSLENGRLGCVCLDTLEQFYV